MKHAKLIGGYLKYDPEQKTLTSIVEQLPVSVEGLNEENLRDCLNYIAVLQDRHILIPDNYEAVKEQAKPIFDSFKVYESDPWIFYYDVEKKQLLAGNADIWITEVEEEYVNRCIDYCHAVYEDYGIIQGDRIGFFCMASKHGF